MSAKGTADFFADEAMTLVGQVEDGEGYSGDGSPTAEERLKMAQVYATLALGETLSDVVCKLDGIWTRLEQLG